MDRGTDQKLKTCVIWPYLSTIDGLSSGTFTWKRSTEYCLKLEHEGKTGKVSISNEEKKVLRTVVVGEISSLAHEA
jgi:hypothetical protein